MDDDCYQLVKDYFLQSDIDLLRLETERYWGELQNQTLSEGVDNYINSLLYRELAAAVSLQKSLLNRGCPADRLPEPGCGLLICLVGLSIEPLLQLICCYQPGKILLLMSKEYVHASGEGHAIVTGGNYFAMIREWFQEMQAASQNLDYSVDIQTYLQGLNLDEDLEYVISGDAPNQVFQALINKLQNYREYLTNNPVNPPVVIDITGGKKSMVTGAYLYAALADYPISYVDFDDYHSQHRRPYGFSCRIGTVQHPYSTFQISHWKDVKTQYEKYNFEAASDLIRVVRLEAKTLLQGSQLERLERLEAVLKMYSAWQSGDIVEAYRLSQDFDGQVPRVITLLGDKIQRRKANAESQSEIQQQETLTPLIKAEQNVKTWNRLLEEDQECMLTYARDELAKVQRLGRVQGDWRAAFVRACNLYEHLLRFRLSIAKKTCWIKLKKPVSRYTAQIVFDILKALASPNWQSELPGKKLNVELGEVSPPAFGSQSWADQGEKLIWLRNKAFHELAVIPTDAAQQAVQMVESSWDNLLVEWIPDFNAFPKAGQDDPHYRRLEWQDLLAACGVDFLPPMA